jgi:hypothetical protein
VLGYSSQTATLFDSDRLAKLSRCWPQPPLPAPAAARTKKPSNTQTSSSTRFLGHFATRRWRALAPVERGVLVDCSNPKVRDCRTLALGHSTPGVEVIAAQLPRLSIVKAFNHACAEVLARGPRFGDETVSVYVCGEIADAKRVGLFDHRAV